MAKLMKLFHKFSIIGALVLFACSEKQKKSVDLSEKSESLEEQLAAYSELPWDYSEFQAWKLLDEATSSLGLSDQRVQGLLRNPDQPLDDRILFLATIETENQLSPIFLRRLLDNAIEKHDYERLRFALRLLATREDRKILITESAFADLLQRALQIVTDEEHKALRTNLESLLEEAKKTLAFLDPPQTWGPMKSSGGPIRLLASAMDKSPGIGDRNEGRETRHDRIRNCKSGANSQIKKLKKVALEAEIACSRYRAIILELQDQRLPVNSNLLRLIEALGIAREERVKYAERVASSMQVVRSLRPIVDDLLHLKNLQATEDLVRELGDYLRHLNEKSLLAEARILRMESLAESQEKATELRILLKTLQAMGLAHAVHLRDEEMQGFQVAEILESDPKMKSGQESISEQLDLLKNLSIKNGNFPEVFSYAFGRLEKLIETEENIIDESQLALGKVETEVTRLNKLVVDSSSEIADIQSRIAAESVFLRTAEQLLSKTQNEDIPAWEHRRDKLCPKVK